MNALQVSAASIAVDAVQCAPPDSAIELIPEHDELEKELTDVETSILSSLVQKETPEDA